MNAFRFWNVVDGFLVSPYRGDQLPVSGTIRAHCDQPHAAPYFSCLCGIAYYATADAMREAATTLYLWDDNTVAITSGTIEGKPIADGPRTVGVSTGMTMRLSRVPQAYRAKSYTLDTIYANTTNLVYSVPILPKSSLR